MYLGQQSWTQPQQAKGNKGFGKGQVNGKGCGKKGGKSGEVAGFSTIRIAGCKDGVVGPIIRGEYQKSGENHGKPAYKKEAKAADGLTVLIYFWDERDGVAASGWWIGPSIGGNMVWAHNARRHTSTPPCTGWAAPHGTPEDPTVVISGVGPAAAPGKGAAVQQQHQQKQQQAQQQKTAQNAANQEQLKAKQAEQNAAMAVRKDIGKLKGATAGNIEKLKEELAITMGTEFEKCGSLQGALQVEHDKALVAATERLAKFQEAEKKREAARASAKVLVVELSGLVEEAETASQQLAAQLKAFADKSDLTTEDAVESAIKEAETEAASAAEKVKVAQDFVKEKGTEIRAALPPAPKKPATPTSESKPSEDPDFGGLSHRAGLARSGVEKETKALKGVRTRLLKKVAASDRMDTFRSIFTKYDKDKDGHLNRKEIVALVKGEYSFAVPEAALDKILRVIAAGGKGVKADDFHRLMVSIGAAREQALDSERRKEREETEAAMAEEKKKVQDSLDSVSAVLKEASEAVTELSSKTRALPQESKGMSPQAMSARAEELEATCKDVVAKVKSAHDEANGFGSGEVDKKLESWVKQQKAQLQKRAKGLDEQVVRFEAAIRNFKQQGAVKDRAEVKLLGEKAMKRLRSHLKEKKCAPADLFKQIAGDATDLSADAFVAFAKSLPKAAEEKETEELSEDDLRRGFGMLDEESTGIVSGDTFRLLLQSVMKVVKDVCLTVGFSLADSKALRRLAAGEVVEILEGPVQDEGLDRVRCRTIADDLEGWATVKGNQGSVFLKEGCHTFKVLKETILTEGFALAPAAADTKIHETTRKAKVGELLDVREWGKKQEGTGLTRMRCRMQADGSIGWITVLGSSGTRFVDML